MAGRLSNARAALEKEFVRPSKIKVLEPPPDTAAALAPSAVPAEGTVVVELPSVGPTTVQRTADGFAVPVPNPGHASTNPTQLARKWTPQLVERLVQHALSDDYRASIPAINLLLERAWGKARQAEPEAEQAAIDMSSLPVRDRIKALLEARAAPEQTATPAAAKAVLDNPQ